MHTQELAVNTDIYWQTIYSYMEYNTAILSNSVCKFRVQIRFSLLELGVLLASNLQVSYTKSRI